jgi:hypothetical protein
LLWLILITCSSFRENLPSFLWQGQISKTSILLSFSFRLSGGRVQKPKPPSGLNDLEKERRKLRPTESNNREQGGPKGATSDAAGHVHAPGGGRRRAPAGQHHHRADPKGSIRPAPSPLLPARVTNTLPSAPKYFVIFSCLFTELSGLLRLGDHRVVDFSLGCAD